MTFDLVRRRTVVISPHPDDETLGTGGAIARQVNRGLEVIVVAVTAGEAAYPECDATELAATRRAEQLAALDVLGVTPARVISLGLPDGGVAAREDQLTDALRNIVEPGDLVIAPWRHDWHPDHEACGRAAERAAAGQGCTVLGSMFWAHHHRDKSLLAAATTGSLRLTALEIERRASALAAHVSQLERADGVPILTPDLIKHLDEGIEQYVIDL